MTTAWRIERWIDDASRGAVEYAEYWNDAEAERDKVWDVSDGGFDEVESYLRDSGLESDLRRCLHRLESQYGGALHGRGIDVAAGTLWAEPILLDLPGVEHVCCLEFSEHRLLEIGPRMLEHYGVDPERVTLALGSFYDLRLPDASLDFAFLSQALHHADDPDALLRELSRVLVAGGVVIIVGEHSVKPGYYVRYLARLGASLLPVALQRRIAGGRVEVRRTLRPRGADLVPTDPILGDHVYTGAEYERLFEAAGFEMARFDEPGSDFQSFLLRKRAVTASGSREAGA